MAAPQSQTPAQAAQNNAFMRAALLGGSPRMRKNVQTATAEAGQTTRMKLFNVGVLTRLQLYVTAAFTIGTAIATPSARAPWNLISKLTLTDFDGTDRIKISGFQLFMLNCVRDRTLFGYHNTSANTAVFTNPSVPTAIGNGTLSFFINVPLAFDTENPITQLQDLRGAILGQTAVGEMYLSIDWISSLYANGDVESLYSGAATTTVVKNGNNNISVTLWQEYILPQPIAAGGGVALPQIDLMTVYEIIGNNRSSDNLAVNTEKLVNYPNLRSVIGLYFNYVQASTQTAGKISGFRIIANGNNILQDHSELSQLLYQRNYMITDLDTVPGAYFRSHREKPMETALFGQVQLGITPNTVGATPYIEVGYESFYMKGQALPGMVQSS
jgi:hypothetical protein